MRRVATGGARVGGLGLLLVVVAASAADPPKFDGRGWTVGNQQRTARQVLTEYVLPGQTVENWKELVSSSVFPQPVPIAPFVERLRASLSQGCSSLVWNTIRQDERTAVFEWWDAGCGGFPPTYEIDRVTLEKDGLFRLAYAVKTRGPLPPERRQTWLAILGQVPLAERGPGGASPAVAPGGGAPPGPAAKTLSPDELAAGVRTAGWPCATALKGELKGQIQGPQGPLATWVLECSDGTVYTVLVDPRGSMTSFPTPK
jgi:hypothetical protein